MKHKLLLVALVAGLVLVGAAYAAGENAPMPMGGPAKVEKNVEIRGGGPGMGMGMGMMSDAPKLPPEIRTKLMEQQIKSFKETSQLRDNVTLKRMELQLLWLDSIPSQDKIIAKLREINQAEMALKEKQVADMFAMYNLLPADMRKGFGMRGCCDMMGGMMGDMMPGMGMGMGPNMMQRRIMIRDTDTTPGMMGGMESCPMSPGDMEGEE